MKRNINIIKPIRSFELKSKGEEKEKYHSDIEKKKRHRSAGDTRKEIKYVHLNN